MLFPGAKIPLIVVAPPILPAPPRVAPTATLTGTEAPVAEPDVLFTSRVPADTLNADPLMTLPVDFVRLKVPLPIFSTELLVPCPPFVAPLISKVAPVPTSKVLTLAAPPPVVKVTVPAMVDVPLA